jgi:hypothetical protein
MIGLRRGARTLPSPGESDRDVVRPIVALALTGAVCLAIEVPTEAIERGVSVIRTAMFCCFSGTGMKNRRRIRFLVLYWQVVSFDAISERMELTLFCSFIEPDLFALTPDPTGTNLPDEFRPWDKIGDGSSTGLVGSSLKGLTSSKLVTAAVARYGFYWVRIGFDRPPIDPTSHQLLTFNAASSAVATRGELLEKGWAIPLSMSVC